ncbi:MAG TPA: bifunctional transaldolase/phosoglucose isomerase [Nitrospiria bacterium]|nr:bifunctional transaldolase/phosoglucose isomerase [Nitrospiria bacterium]
MRTAGQQRKTSSAGKEDRFSASLGPHENPIREALRSLDEQRFVERFFAKDDALWKPEPDARKTIAHRLGWLTVADTMAEQSDDLTAFARSVRASGFSHAVLLGMGGSSLGPAVLRNTFGVRPGYPDLQVLDSTDPATILRVEKAVDLPKTLFIAASKSGTTIEVDALYRYFHTKIKTVNPDQPGNQFIAITDPGTPLEVLARTERFRRTFLNPSDIGGRYSVLSYFGLVPGVLTGMDPAAFLDRAGRMIQRCGPEIPAEKNPGLSLGVILGEMAKAGRDKVTLITPPPIQNFGIWVEQLLAESTGKEGKGLIPVEGEAIGRPEVYGNDRLFVYLAVSSSPDRKLRQSLQALERAGHPVVRILIHDPLDLAGEFFRWEFATAVAGALLKVNPFDEPNVAESKENTRKVLDAFQKTRTFPKEEPFLEEGGMLLYGNSESIANGSLKEAVWNLLDRAGPGDYVALMAYLEASGANDSRLQTIRSAIRDRRRVATTLGYGPRFLHSTGQLHKGGPGRGLFIQITAEDDPDLPIPGEPYTFGILKKAQALGDFHSLSNRSRPVLRIHLGSDVEPGLKRLARALGSTRKR